MGANTVVITQGDAGTLLLQGDTIWRADAFDVEAIDPSGGGDAFTAGFITGLLRGYDLGETLRYASALGALATLALGTTTSVPEAEQVRHFLDAHPLRVTQVQEGSQLP
jgi:sugar/nucleoside kinase (ribokinase family)